MGKGGNKNTTQAVHGADDQTVASRAKKDDSAATMSTAPTEEYVFKHPPLDDGRGVGSHFSSLLLSADWFNTGCELLLLGGLTFAAYQLPPEVVNVEGSMPLRHVALFFWAGSIFRRVYNSYLEACYFSFPQYRTQPVSEHQLKKVKDVCGRDLKQLQTLVLHDRATLFTQFMLDVGLYYAIPGYYPAPPSSVSEYGTGQVMFERIVRLHLNHYIMSFGMYWMHRACHMVPWMWEKIHSIHHYADHPLSRTTYQDHWFDNFANAVIGHCFAQILMPLDHPTFFFSRFFRMAESLEKHSGISCYLNLAHQTQQWLPFAQMPHHHDYHHEGHKSCNYTFSSLGGAWDCIFGTRKAGRANLVADPKQKTLQDVHWDPENKNPPKRTILDTPAGSLTPVIAVAAAAITKLCADGFVVAPLK